MLKQVKIYSDTWAVGYLYGSIILYIDGIVVGYDSGVVVNQQLHC